jgi:hypothetical protein
MDSVRYSETYCLRSTRRYNREDITYHEGYLKLKLVRLIKMCLNETYGKVRVGKHLSDIAFDNILFRVLIYTMGI